MLLLWIFFLLTAFCSDYSSSCSLYSNVFTRCFCGCKQISVEIWHLHQEDSRCETRKVSGSPSQRIPLQRGSDSSKMLTQIISRTRWPPYSSCLLASRAICSSVSLQKSGQLSIRSDSFSNGLILTPAASQTAQVLTTHQGKVVVHCFRSPSNIAMWILRVLCWLPWGACPFLKGQEENGGQRGGGEREW